jgi:hypothetical protein
MSPGAHDADASNHRDLRDPVLRHGQGKHWLRFLVEENQSRRLVVAKADDEPRPSTSVI